MRCFHLQSAAKVTVVEKDRRFLPFLEVCSNGYDDLVGDERVARLSGLSDAHADGGVA